MQQIKKDHGVVVAGRSQMKCPRQQFNKDLNIIIIIYKLMLLFIFSITLLPALRVLGRCQYNVTGLDRSRGLTALSRV